MSPPSTLAILRRLPAAFWLVNGTEVLERAAQAAVVAVLGVHMVGTLGFSGAAAGLVFAVLLSLTYFVPAVAGSLAGRFGFRALLPACFLLLAVGYALMGVVTTFEGMVVAAVVAGVGAGVYRPIVAAVTAQATSEAHRDLGFSVYYWGINLGAFLAPLAIGVALPLPLFRLALFAAAGVLLLNLAVVLLAFRDVAPLRRAEAQAPLLRGLGLALRDRRFVALLAIVGGYWFMRSVNTTFLPVFVLNHVALPPWFPLPAIKSVNPAIILVAIPLLAPFLRQRSSLTSMVAGIAATVVAMAAIAFIPGFWPLLGAVALYSVGEVLVQPAFLAHVSKVAPAPQRTAYLGCAFLPMGIGYVAGSLAQGWMYDAFLVGQGAVAMFWSGIAALGLVALSGLVLYRSGVAEPALRPAPARRVSASGALAVALLLLGPALLAAAASHGPAGPGPGPPEASLGGGAVEPQHWQGYTREGEASTRDLRVPAETRGTLTVRLTWRDEPPTLPGMVNAPDRLRLTVAPPAGPARSVEAANPAGGEGAVEVALPAAAGLWRLRVEVLEAGDPAGPLGSRLAPDAGNAWAVRAALAEGT